jgi:arylsulfatase A-like enzyme
MLPRFFVSLARLLLAAACLPTAFILAETKPDQRHVVVVVWDGMRPDFISERNTPTLWKLAREGVTFRQHHSVYPTMTYVNGAAIATGTYPNRNGVLANREFRPRIAPQTFFETADREIIRKGDDVSDGKYLALATIAEIVRGAGRRAVTVGTKSVTFLHDRHAEWTTTTASKNSHAKFSAAPMPPNLREEALRFLGSFPAAPAEAGNESNIAATRVLTGLLWREDLPAYSLLWLSEPDLTQHDHSPGAELSLAAIRDSDRNLATVLDAIVKKNAKETTDVVVVSDHGFSTIERGLDFPQELRAAGFDAVAAFEQAPKAGQIMVVGNAGTILFYIIGHDRTVAARLVEWLQHSDFAGVIFSREEFEGAFPLETVHANTTDAPDVMVALRWNSKPNKFGVAGQIITDFARGAGQGSHATLSEFDVHNTLIAAGPGFRRGMMSDLPSSNVDLAPTILRLLGMESPHKFDGRVLSEAMTGQSSMPRATTQTLEFTRKFPSGRWRQHLRISRVGETTYIDEGNGAFEASTSSSQSTTSSPGPSSSP